MHYSATIRLCIFLSFVFVLSRAASQEAVSEEGAPEEETPIDLESLKQTQRKCFSNARSCVLLLNEKGSVGCSQCGKKTITSPLREVIGQQQVSDLKDKDDEEILFAVESIAFHPTGLLRRLKGLNTQIARAVVIAEADGVTGKNQTEGEEEIVANLPPLQEYSSDTTIPNRDYIYNINDSLRRPSVPLASDLQLTRFPFNVFYISADDADKISKAREDAKLQNGPEFRIQSIGKMDACPSPLPPQPTESAKESPVPTEPEEQEQRQTRLQEQTNSSHCLSERTCMPVGGYSVWSTSSLINETTFNATEEKQEIVAVTAPMDSSALFHDLAYGTASEVASVAALIAIVKSVGDYRRATNATAKRHPMFFAFNAQSWGFAGSGRFLEDIFNFECNQEMPKKPGLCTNPIAPSLKFKALKNVTMSVINLSGLVDQTNDETLPDESGSPRSVGSNYSFYIHGFKDGNKAGSGGTVERVMIEQFRKSNLTLSDGFRNSSFIDASQSFQEYVGDADVVSLTNFQGNYSNRYYHSIYDRPDLLRKESLQPLYAVARAVAQSVIQLCFDDENVKIIDDPAETIDDVIGCLTSNWKDKNCTLAETILGDEVYGEYVDKVKSHNYAGVFTPPDFAMDHNPSGYRKSVFLQHLMAYYNRLEPTSSETIYNCTKSDDCDELTKKVNSNDTTAANYHPTFCVKNRCVIAESHLHAAFGTGLKEDPEDEGARSSFMVLPPIPTVEANPSSVPGEIDEVPPDNAAWTESNWEKDPEVCYTIVDTMRFGGAILGAGLSTFVASLLISFLFLNPKKKTPPAVEQDTLLPEANDLIDQP